MEKVQLEAMYDSSDEKELIKMWEDIKGNNADSLSRNLMKAIATNEEGKESVNEDVLYTRQMWDSDTRAWVPFDLWGAHYIVNERKEDVQLRIYRPVSIQPEFGPTLRGWQSLDSSYLNEQLKENKNPQEKFNQHQSFSGRQAFCEIVRQDQDEYASEGRYSEMNGNIRNRSV